ncbi:hypothetical protein BN970_03903 [Mycolicibacterium conceptionense]|uniref:Uncharacterized protein n=1 Tax=Mycolicibacterium conceptionense TaxID=451644 RepID=A0A0U1DMW4_9MYCO|nr:hypothetical protein BN970_03903 [Mycolicibacterium conceptionense]
MMICVAFIGGGGVVSVVSVLCGAGGGLTVQPLNRSAGTETSAPIIRWARRMGVGTLLRVTSPCGRHCRAPALTVHRLHSYSRHQNRSKSFKVQPRRHWLQNYP